MEGEESAEVLAGEDVDGDVDEEGMQVLHVGALRALALSSFHSFVEVLVLVCDWRSCRCSWGGFMQVCDDNHGAGKLGSLQFAAVQNWGQESGYRDVR